jgi:hypothetical protein
LGLGPFVLQLIQTADLHHWLIHRPLHQETIYSKTGICATLVMKDVRAPLLLYQDTFTNAKFAQILLGSPCDHQFASQLSFMPAKSYKDDPMLVEVMH